MSKIQKKKKKWILLTKKGEKQKGKEKTEGNC